MIQIFDIKKHKKLENNDDELLNRYIAESKKNASTILEDLQTTPNGISEKEAEERLNKFGANVVIKNEKKSRIYFLAQSFKDKFIIILIMLAIINYFISDALSAYIILGIALLSALIRYFQDYSVYKFNQSLKSKLYTVTHILRNGKEKEIKVEKVVKGDVVKLNAGSMIPADLYLIDSKDLFINQSVFTGESAPIEKKAISEENNCKEIFNIPNICLMGASVISGSATGVVIEKGFSTYLGRMGKEIDNKRELTNFEKGMNNITKMLIKYMIIVSFSVFAIYGLIRQNFLEAILFALSVAVGITPSMLPMIVNVNLTRGTKVLAKKKTLVKNINSIQNLGAIDILCTDKTGTLTEDKIVLEKYLNIKGNEDLRILKHAFLNAFFQTGLKGNIDEAVIKRGLENGMGNFRETYKKVDEIPFDFSRRRLSVIVDDGSKKQMITKGAVEEILSICTMVDDNGTVYPITKSIKDNIRKISKNLNEDGLRVVAVCQKNDILQNDSFDVSDEKNMVLLGFIGFLDPPKESAKESIKKLNKAGIRVIVLTGDNAEVTKCICSKVGINTNKIVLGTQIDKLQDAAVLRLLKKTNVFAKLSPIQKARIVRLLKDSGNIVGYMGDGINDSPSLTNSDVGISVDTAVDIAKESADIILLEKDLNVLIDGVSEGRRTFVNLMKYIKLATSFNFGEVMSVIIASVVLPFLPETPIQLLVEGLLYDFGQMTLPFDHVDKEDLEKPKKLDINSLKHFMFFWGPLSSSFDMIVFACLWFLFNVREAALFQTIWFSYSIVSNLVGMHIIRTVKLPFIQSNAHKAVYISSISLIIIGLLVPFTGLGAMIGLVPMQLSDIALIFGVTFLYCIVAIFAKKIYLKKYKEWM